MNCRAKHLELLKVPTQQRDIDWYTQLNRIIQKQRFFCKTGQHYYWVEWFRDEVNQPPCPHHPTSDPQK